jgi:hypothetical protein
MSTVVLIIFGISTWSKKVNISASRVKPAAIVRKLVLSVVDLNVDLIWKSIKRLAQLLV